MYLSDPSDQLFAYKCENDNRCLYKVMNGKFVDFNLNNCSSSSEKTINSSESTENMVETTNYNGNVGGTEVRNEEVLSLKNKFPNKVPIIIRRFPKEVHLPILDKTKFLVPQEITMSQFQTIIRNRLRLGPNQALYLLVNNRSMMSLSLTLAEVYSEHADPEGFLNITYASQEVFGT